MDKSEIVPPVLLVIFKTIDLGELNPLEVRNPKLLSVDDAVTPLAKLYTPPLEVPVSAPVPEVPAAWGYAGPVYMDRHRDSQ